MSSDINKGLKTLWKAEPLKFHDFQFVSYPDALHLILHVPKKYSKTTGFLDDNRRPVPSLFNKETSLYSNL